MSRDHVGSLTFILKKRARSLCSKLTLIGNEKLLKRVKGCTMAASENIEGDIQFTSYRLVFVSEVSATFCWSFWFLGFGTERILVSEVLP